MGQRLFKRSGSSKRRSKCRFERVRPPLLFHFDDIQTKPEHLDAPNVLKKELGQLLNIQGEFEGLEKTVRHATKLIHNGTIPKSNLQHLDGMLEQLARIREQADSMYASLNVNSDFPLLSGVDLDFVRRLFLLRHLKATVQKKATSTMWEFDKLDQASGGKDMALGTP